jgi:predicted DNA-binding protein YlxM (UPF0122 family)
MTTGFSYKFAQKLLDGAKKQPNNKVLKVGSLCVKTDTPLSEVAEYLSVSRQSVYSWMVGEYQPDEERMKKVDRLIVKLEKKAGKPQAAE